jgi:hypothetical protein
MNRLGQDSTDSSQLATPILPGGLQRLAAMAGAPTARIARSAEGPALIVIAEQRRRSGIRLLSEFHRQRMPAQRAHPLPDLDIRPVDEPGQLEVSGRARARTDPSSGP